MYNRSQKTILDLVMKLIIMMFQKELNTWKDR